MNMLFISHLRVVWDAARTAPQGMIDGSGDTSSPRSSSATIRQDLGAKMAKPRIEQVPLLPSLPFRKRGRVREGGGTTSLDNTGHGD